MYLILHNICNIHTNERKERGRKEKVEKEKREEVRKERREEISKFNKILIYTPV